MKPIHHSRLKSDIRTGDRVIAIHPGIDHGKTPSENNSRSRPEAILEGIYYDYAIGDIGVVEDDFGCFKEVAIRMPGRFYKFASRSNWELVE